MDVQVIPTSGSSAELVAEIEKLKADIAKLQADQMAIDNRLKQVEAATPPEPLPT